MTKIQEDLLVKTPVFEVVKKKFKDTTFEPVGLNCKPWAMVIAVDDTLSNNPVTVFVEQTRWGLEHKTIEFPCGTVEPDDFVQAAVHLQVTDDNVYKVLGRTFVTPDMRTDEVGPVDITKLTPEYLGEDVYNMGIALAAAREFQEETGINVEPGELTKIGEFNPNPAYFNNTMTIFYIKKSSLLEDFNKRSNQNLDADEDCRVFVGRFDTYVPSVRKHGMGIAALFFVEGAEAIVERNRTTEVVKALSQGKAHIGGLDELKQQLAKLNK